jgi:hypothetical protein
VDHDRQRYWTNIDRTSPATPEPRPSLRPDDKAAVKHAQAPAGICFATINAAKLLYKSPARSNVSTGYWAHVTSDAESMASFTKALGTGTWRKHLRTSYANVIPSYILLLGCARQ